MRLSEKNLDLMIVNSENNEFQFQFNITGKLQCVRVLNSGLIEVITNENDKSIHRYLFSSHLIQ